jgi:single-strand DNA-binding protein
MLNMLNMLKGIDNKFKRFKPMANLNRVTVMGVLGRDPETKQFPNGGSITTFSVATIDNWKD